MPIKMKMLITTSLLFLLGCQSRKGPDSTPASLEHQMTPAKPMGVTAKAEDGSVLLTWKKVTNASSYNVYWSTRPGVSKKDKRINRIRDNRTRRYPLENGATYYFRIAAVGPGGESQLSKEVSATPAPAVREPKDVTAYVGRLSHDGNTAVFVGDGCNGTPCVYLRDGEDPVLLLAGPVAVEGDLSYPAISGDGNTIAYTSAAGLMILRKEAGQWQQQHLIAGRPNAVFPSLSANGNRVAWINNGKLVVSTHSGDSWTDKSVDSATRVALAGSGDWLVYERANQVFIAERSDQDWFETLIGNGGYPAISYSGQRVIYHGEVDDQIEIFTEGDSLHAPLDQCCDEPPSISDNGQTIGFGRFALSYATNQWTATTFTDKAKHVSISGNGTKVIYWANNNIYVQPLADHSVPQQIDILTFP